MEHFVNKVTQIFEDLQKFSDEIKKVDRRLDTLAVHFEQCENHKKHKAIYDKYRKLDPKKRDAFYDKHSEEIELYKNANEYLKAVLQDRTKIPIGDWKKEQEKLNAHRYSLCEKFYGLKDEVKMTEVIKRSIEDIINKSTEMERPKRVQQVER